MNMNPSRVAFVPALLLLVALVSCERDAINAVEPPENHSGLRTGSSAACNAFQYSDSIFYLRDQVVNYIVRPVTAQAGTYGSFPGGMVINATTGAINVNKSETGLKYRVWFVKAGTSDTCTRFVTISGVNFTSRVYDISLNDTLAVPFYNAIRTLGTPCTDDDDDDDDDDEEEDDDDDDACEFDDGSDDDDGDGTGDEPPAGQQVIPQGVDINKLIGTINLKQTVANGVFGATPVNGTARSFRIYYRLNDASNRALNYIDVTLHYYTTAASVPTSLLSQITDKQGATLRRAAPNAPTMDVRRPRPPDIVIVGY